jgi:hypothetical protein
VTGVVDDDVEPAEELGRRRDEGRCRCRVDKVRLHGERAAAELLDRRDGPRGLARTAAVVHHHVGPGPRELQRDACADPLS